MTFNKKADKHEQLEREKERIDRQIAELNVNTLSTSRISIRLTPQDEQHILNQQFPGQDPSKTIKQALRHASIFKRLRTQKIADIIQDITFFEITDEDLEFDTRKKIDDGICGVLSDLWKNAKNTKQGKLKRLIQTYKEKYV